MKVEKHPRFKEVKKKRLVKDIAFREQVVVSETKNIKHSYIIFALQNIKQDYGIEYDTILVLEYLYEIGVFGLTVDVEKRKIRLKNYVIMNLIVRDYQIQGKELYRLTEKSNKIVSEFNYMLSDNKKFMADNREVEVGVDVKVSNALSSYFS